MLISLKGNVPAKKNRWHRAKNGRIYFDQDGIAEQIASLTWQLKAQHKGKPLSNPSMIITFYCKDNRGDIDNKLSTLLDCMVAAEVLQNDNMTHLRGPITIHGVKRADEGVDISICAN
jgi:Holliday junction resolvase RusA-like endonuclease